MVPQSKPGYKPSKPVSPSIKPPTKPYTPSVTQPSGKPGYKPSKPSVTSPPVTRPTTPSISGPTTKPGNKPSRPTVTPPVSKPSTPSITAPSTKPGHRPSNPSIQLPPSSGIGIPSIGGSTKPSKPGHPSLTKPGTPLPPMTKPGGRPGGDDFIGMRPGSKPATKPGVISDGKPVKPTPLPGVVGGPKPTKPIPPPGLVNKPAKPIPLPTRPPVVSRPPRPELPPQWQHVENHHVQQWNQWQQDNRVTINNIQINRTNHWTTINNHYRERGWAAHYGSPDYRRWHHSVIDYRRDRCREIWYHRHHSWNSYFDHHWWGTCWWRPRPPVVYVQTSPWWWWRPFVWTSVGAFFGTALAPQPVVYDPGTTVIYEGDTYYINGQPAGSAVEARQNAIQLATPELEELPVPEPAAEGEAEQWLPMGVWALTQVEQGDATMFMQLSVDKEGIVAGAYKNVLTGDEQPIVGRLDKETQRVAWHVGENTGTVYETGFSGFENDVVSIFVHFGEDQTQNWLLVRLPSPEMPPGTVKLPEPSGS